MQTLFVWLFFLLGSVLCVFTQAEIRVNSDLNGYKSLKHYYSVHGWLITTRVFVGSMLFWAGLYYRGGVNVFLPDAAASWDFTIPPLAAVLGVGMDAGLDIFIAKMGWQKIVPPVSITITKTETKETTTEEKTTEKTTVSVPPQADAKEVSPKDGN